MDDTGVIPTSSEVASRLGCNHSTISRLRSGSRRPSRGLLIRVILEYQLDPEEALELMTVAESGTAEESARLFSELFDRSL